MPFWLCFGIASNCRYVISSTFHHFIHFRLNTLMRILFPNMCNLCYSLIIRNNILILQNKRTQESSKKWYQVSGLIIMKMRSIIYLLTIFTYWIGNRSSTLASCSCHTHAEIHTDHPFYTSHEASAYKQLFCPHEHDEKGRLPPSDSYLLDKIRRLLLLILKEEITKCINGEKQN
jgi:hypothetical protein